MSLAVLFHFLCAQHVSDLNISTITPHATKHHKCTVKLNPPSLQNKTTDVIIQQQSRKLLMLSTLEVK